jgi:hypothetical protein
MGLAALAFYWGCRLFQVTELHEAVKRSADDCYGESG